MCVAAALSCYGGQIQGRLVLDEEEKLELRNLVSKTSKKYNIDDMVKSMYFLCYRSNYR